MAIQSARIAVLNEAVTEPEGRYVLYWMQQAQRVHGNHALEYAIEEANTRHLPVLVCFGLTDGYPEANARHYAFMARRPRGYRTSAARPGASVSRSATACRTGWR